MPRNLEVDKPPSLPRGLRRRFLRRDELFWREFDRLNSPELQGCYSRLYLRARENRGRLYSMTERAIVHYLGFGNARPWRRVKAALASTGHIVIIDDRTIEVPAALSPPRTKSNGSI